MLVTRFLASALVLTAALSTFAKAPVDASETGFYFPEQLPVKPLNLDRAYQAVVKIGSLTYGNGVCAGVLISRNYVMTNLHCISMILFKKWGYEPNIQIDEQSFPHYKFRRISTQVPAPIEFNNPIRMNFFLWDQRMNIESVVWLGQGWQNHDEKFVQTLSQDEFNSFKALSKDIAILKYKDETYGQVPARTCLPLATNRVLPGRRLWTIGYPSGTHRENGFNSDDRSKYVSYGRVRGSVRQDPVLQDYASEMSAQDQKVFWTREKQIWEQPHLLITGIDIVTGNSGGAMIDAEGKLQGLTFTGTAPYTDYYTGGNAYAIHARSIKAMIAKDLGQKRANEIFDCK